MHNLTTIPKMIDADFHLPNPTIPAQPYLDPQNQSFIDAGTKVGGPPLESLYYTTARTVLEDLQAHFSSPDITRSELCIRGISIKTYIYKSNIKLDGVLKTIFYFHGGGWILGSPDTHDSLMKD